MAKPEAHATQTTFVDYGSPSLWETLNNHLIAYIEIMTDRTVGFSDPERRNARESNLYAAFGVFFAASLQLGGPDRVILTTPPNLDRKWMTWSTWGRKMP